MLIAIPASTSLIKWAPANIRESAIRAAINSAVTPRLKSMYKKDIAIIKALAVCRLGIL